MIGRTLGPYEIVALIGAGGMGEVYRARDTRLNRDVAVKVVPEAMSRDAERLRRLQSEAQLLASLNHPQIATIHGLEEADGTYGLVMELVEGDDLRQRLARGPIPTDEAITIARQIALALEAAHARGIIHRAARLLGTHVRCSADHRTGDRHCCGCNRGRVVDGALARSRCSTSAPWPPLGVG